VEYKAYFYPIYARIVETDKENQKGEKLEKPKVIDCYIKFTQDVDRVDQMLQY
jgi:hypothetical protein